MKKRGAIELSLNFIVVLVISIVLFGFGIVFMTELTSQANEIRDMSFSELDQRVQNLVCEGQDRVCIGEERKVIKRKESGIFGIKIVNVLPTDSNFEITVDRPNPSGYDKNKNGISSDNLAFAPASRTLRIKRSEEIDIGVGVQVPPDAFSGTYIFNVDIKAVGTGVSYTPTIKFYVVVP